MSRGALSTKCTISVTGSLASVAVVLLMHAYAQPRHSAFVAAAMGYYSHTGGILP